MTPLQDLRVLELGQYIAAPYAAMMLADQGAEVIKIERPSGGDPRRSYDPAISNGDRTLSGGFLSYNRNKKSVTIDLTDEAGRQSFLALVETADVVVENLRPGAMDRLGLGYNELKQHNPRLVYAGISGYGRLPQRRGKYADRPAFDTAIQAMGGMMFVTGQPDGPPLPGVTGFADIYSAVQATVGILTALHGRALSGLGAFVDVSMYDSVASLMERELMLWDFTHEPRARGVDRYAPLGALRAQDGHVALILPTEEMWLRLCQAVNRLDMTKWPSLSTVIGRAENFDAVLRPELEKWTTNRTRRTVVEHFSDFGLPAGEVQGIEELYACSHLEDRGMFLKVDDGMGGTHRMIRTPTLIDCYDGPRSDSAPDLGADNHMLLDSIPTQGSA